MVSDDINDVQTPQKGDLFPNSKVKHGTLSGSSKHSKLKEKPCDACRQARKEYRYSIDDYPSQQRDRRYTSRAILYAINKLREEFDGEYKRYYKEERYRHQESIDKIFDRRLRRRKQLSVYMRATRFAQSKMRSRYPEKYNKYYTEEKARLIAQDLAEKDTAIK